jgi:uncharacterized protein YjbI with pentapeptide repeats
MVLQYSSRKNIHMSRHPFIQRFGLEAALVAGRPCRALLLTLIVASAAARADITTWNNGQVIPGTQGIALGPGVDLSGWNTPGHQLEFAAFASYNLTNASFATSDIASAQFGHSILTGANFSGAVIKGIEVSGVTGLTASQIYGTASYISGDLTGIVFEQANLSGWNFANQNLTNASFYASNLTTANFTNANLANATLYAATLTSANFTNANLTSAKFAGSRLTSANISGAIVKGADFGYTINITSSQIYSTASYISGDLTGIALDHDDLTGWNLANENLANANFNVAFLTNANFTKSNLTNASFFGSSDGVAATLTNTNFSGAMVKGVNFRQATSTGFTASQLYSTASYSSRDLTGIVLGGNDLTGWNFANQKLTSANFAGSALTNTNFTDADLRGASGWTPIDLTIVHNTIRPDGSIQSLALLSGETLVVNNNPIAIMITSSATLDPAATLKFLLDNHWTSPIGFSPGLTPTLAGTLDLEFAQGVDPASLLGQTVQLFHWNGPLSVANRFTTLKLPGGGLTWDTSQLYTAGTLKVGGVLGDYNYDGLVDAADYTLWRDTLGSTTNRAADGNDNDVVDAGDFSAWSSHFGQSVNGVPGDYNHNGIVDAADYTIWRDTLGSTTDLRANGASAGASAGKIDQADYLVWKSNFGMHSGSGANGNTAVPEPKTGILSIIGGTVAGFLIRRRA